jgi:hypothetical protein
MKTINANALPTLANCFSRCHDFIGDTIVLFDGGAKALKDPNWPSHSWPITREYGDIMTTDEIEGGLTEESLNRFCEEGDLIVSCYYWTGWDDPILRSKAEAWLAGIRSIGGSGASYNFQFIWYRLFKALHLTFIANIWKKSIRFQAMTCSQESNRLLRTFGCPWAKSDDDISPSELERIMKKAYQENNQCKKITNFYM